MGGPAGPADPRVAGRRVAVDRDRCIGSGNCVVYAAGTFGLDDGAKAYVLDPSSPAAPGDPDAVRLAVEACPTGALHWVDEG